MNLITNKNDISIVVISYNQEKFITRCIESIVSQNFEGKIELLIGDDASTDSTVSKIKESILDDFKGIGETRKAELLKHFGTIKNLKHASIDDLVKQKGIGQKTAERLIKFLEEN